MLIIADGTANPDFVAIDLLAQAEHGTGKERVYLVAVGERVIDAVEHAIEIQLTSLQHSAKLRETLSKGFCAIQVPDFAKAVELTNFIAPEHLELQVAEKELKKLAAGITTAGAVFIGHHTPTVLGDFTAGPSHTLPTGRTGRFFSGLQVTDFMRRTSVVEYDLDSLRKAAPVVTAFAAMEKLEAHGRSLTRRLEALPTAAKARREGAGKEEITGTRDRLEKGRPDFGRPFCSPREGLARVEHGVTRTSAPDHLAGLATTGTSGETTVFFLP